MAERLRRVTQAFKAYLLSQVHSHHSNVAWVQVPLLSDFWHFSGQGNPE